MTIKENVVLSLMGIAIIIAALSLSVSIGTVAIPVKTVWAILLDKLVPGITQATWSEGTERIVWLLRFPRALLAIIVGAGLGMAGAAMQSVARNPLADPHLLGVSAGAALGANIAILVTGDIFGPLTVPLFSFLGALIATMIVMALAGLARSSESTRLVLAGVAISFVITALTNIMAIKADPRSLATVIFWMLGGLGFAQWENLVYPAFALIVSGLIFVLRAKVLDALNIGDETAVTLGVNVNRQRYIILITNAFLTGVLVAFSGMIGFVGLMMPHIARAFIGGSNRHVLPVSALLGAIFLLLSDIIARTITAPGELPVGIVTGLAGGLFILFLLRRPSMPFIERIYAIQPVLKIHSERAAI